MLVDVVLHEDSIFATIGGHRSINFQEIDQKLKKFVHFREKSRVLIKTLAPMVVKMESPYKTTSASMLIGEFLH